MMDNKRLVAVVSAVAVSTAVVLVGGAVAYRVVVVEPQLQQKRDAQAKDDADAKAKKDVADQTRQRYEMCVAKADGTYHSDWNNSCSDFSLSRELDFQRCVTRLSITIASADATSMCRADYPVVPASGCNLPTPTASRWDENWKSEKRMCLEKAQAGL